MSPKFLAPEVFPYASVEIVHARTETFDEMDARLRAEARAEAVDARLTADREADAWLRARQTARRTRRQAARRTPIAILFLALFVSVPASAQSLGPAPYVVLALGSSVDLATTLDAIHSGRGQEGNPLLSHGGDAGLIAVKVVSTAAVAVLMTSLAKRGHPRVATILGYVLGGGLTVLAARNARVGR